MRVREEHADAPRYLEMVRMWRRVGGAAAALWYCTGAGATGILAITVSTIAARQLRACVLALQGDCGDLSTTGRR